MSRLRVGGVGTKPLPPMPTVAAGAPEAPVLPFTVEGVLAAVELAGAHLRWNRTRHAIMIRQPGSDQYVFGDDEELDDLTTAMSQAARGQRGNTIGAYWVPGARLERRLLGVAARQDSYEGDGDQVYEAVVAWCEQRKSEGVECRLSLTTVMRQSDCLLGWETGPRSSAVARRSATDALKAKGWRYVVARPVGQDGRCIPGQCPRKMWCSPAYDLA